MIENKSEIVHLDYNKELMAKINYEYELFYLEMLSTSRSNLYTRSADIEFKKRIFGYLRSWLFSHKDADPKPFMTVNNLLDECCRYSEDHEEQTEEESVGKYLLQLQSS